jgi:hypothetical protein
MRDIDLTQLYIGDYLSDTLDFTADQHRTFQTLLLHLWLRQPASLSDRWIRKHAALSRAGWHGLRPLLREPLERALCAIGYWNEAVKAYDGQRLAPSQWQVVRTIILTRDKHVCAYCGSEEDLHVDHRIPLARGGSNSFDNLVTACGPCNLSKGPKPLDIWLASMASWNKASLRTLFKRR